MVDYIPMNINQCLTVSNPHPTQAIEQCGGSDRRARPFLHYRSGRYTWPIAASPSFL
jgi:hypothetical protein